MVLTGEPDVSFAIFIGIPQAVAVAIETNQIVAFSFSRALTHFRRKSVDLKMGIVLLSRDF